MLTLLAVCSAARGGLRAAGAALQRATQDEDAGAQCAVQASVSLCGL